MVYTVGLLAPNGNVGAQTLPYLLDAHKAGKIKLVVLHRPNGPPKNLPQDIAGLDVRPIDIDGDQKEIEKAVQGLNVVISTLGAQAISSEVHLLEALSKLEDFHLFVPCLFGSVALDAEDAERPQFEPIVAMITSSSAKAEELGVPIATVDSGMFADYFFGHAALGPDLKRNYVRANAKQMKNGVHITSLPYLGAALATIATSPDVKTFAGKKFSAIEISPSGQDLVDVYTKIHNGTPTEVQDYTEADHEQLINGPPTTSVGAIYNKQWQNGSWQVREKIAVKGRERQTLEELARQWA